MQRGFVVFLEDLERVQSQQRGASLLCVKLESKIVAVADSRSPGGSADR